MKCYNCNVELSEHDFCTACGADVGLYKKIIRLSNAFYNDGLEKARVRDLSGAAASLRQSLKCYKYNTDARNLLGLVYFEMGEAVEAMSEWVISKSFQPKKNIADDFLDSVQNNPSKWDNIRQTIKKYNQVLEYCRQDSLDLAAIQLKSLLKMNPKIVKGHQLLALLYINQEQWDKALRCVQRAKQIDTNNITTLLYEKEIEDAIRAKDELDPEAAAKRRKKNKHQNKDVIEYVSGNETIIQPLNQPEHAAGVTTVVNIFIGLMIGLAIMWYLILPSKIREAQKDAGESVVEISNQLTEKSAGMDEMQKRVDGLEAENDRLMKEMSALTGDTGVVKANDLLMGAALEYMSESADALSVAGSLAEISDEYVNGELGTDTFKKLYQFLYETTGANAAEAYLEKGKNSLENGNYAEAIDNFARAYQLDDTMGEALFELAEACRKAGEQERAQEVYAQVIESFPDSDYAKSAKKYVDDTSKKPADNEVGEPTVEVPQAEAVVPSVTVDMPGETSVELQAGAAIQ